jgi:hypothetical protein
MDLMRMVPLNSSRFWREFARAILIKSTYVTQTRMMDPESLLHVLEKLLTISPAAPKTSSGKYEFVRWACGLIKNLAKSEDNAAFIGQKRILQRWDRRLDRKPSSPSNSGTETQPSDLIE